jgi:hypothetical protein
MPYRNRAHIILRLRLPAEANILIVIVSEIDK